MRRVRWLGILAAVLLTGLLVVSLPGVLGGAADVPGLGGTERQLLRLWIVGSPGGGQAWLTQQLRTWESSAPA